MSSPLSLLAIFLFGLFNLICWAFTVKVSSRERSGDAGALGC